MSRRSAIFSAAFLLFCPPIPAAETGSWLKIEPTGKIRRPFAWEAVRAGADMARFSVHTMKSGGAQGFSMGLAGLALTAPVAVLAVPLDLVASPFRRRHFVRYQLRARIVGETGSPAAGVEIVSETAGFRKTIDDDPGHRVFRSTAAATTDADGWFELGGNAFFGPNRDFSVALSLKEPPQPLGKLNFERRRGKVGIEGDIPLSGRYRLLLEVPAESETGDE